MDSLPNMPTDVAAVFATYSAEAAARLLEIRDLILETAASTAGVGRIEETLKWGEPAYLTTKSKAGSTLRLGWKAARPDECFVFLNCQTSLAETFREWFGDELLIEGNRAVVLLVNEPVPVETLTRCIEAALTYHLQKTRGVERIEIE